MSLIKCPECGQTVLSVASTCPHCEHRLSPDPIPRSGLSDLAECPRCRKLLTKTTVLCPHCGFHARRFRLILRSVVAVLVLAALSVAGYFAFRAPAQTGIPMAGPAPAPTVPESIADTPAPVDTAFIPPTETDPEARAAAPARQSPPPPPPVGPGLEQGGLRPVATRYTTNWVNVREARSTSAPVAQILRPGTAVRVGGFQNGWWGVFIDDRLVGYVASDLLDTVPPD